MRLPIICYTLLLATALTLCACASHREVHRSHAVSADTLATKVAQDTHLKTLNMRVDSLFNIFRQHYSEESSATSDEQETINETITTTTDSLGREQRTEQRIINRKASREENRKQELWQQQMQMQMQMQQQRYDSLFNAFESRMESHWQQTDSTSEVKNVNSTPQSWWQRIKERIISWIVAFILVGAIWLTRRWWIKLLSK